MQPQTQAWLGSECSSSASRLLVTDALLLLSEHVERLFRAAAIERAYACSAARVVPARVGAAAVADEYARVEKARKHNDGSAIDPCSKGRAAFDAKTEDKALRAATAEDLSVRSFHADRGIGKAAV